MLVCCFPGSACPSSCNPALKAKRSAIERHHLFPKAYLARTGIADRRETNQIANYALVEWKDNDDVSDKSPANYLPKYLERFSSEAAEMYYWHALPANWESMDYLEFLVERRRLMAAVIRDAFQRLSND